MLFKVLRLFALFRFPGMLFPIGEPMKNRQVWLSCGKSALVYGYRFSKFHYLLMQVKTLHSAKDIWVKVFKNEPSKTYGRQSLKNFTWSILEYLDPFLFKIFKTFALICQLIMLFLSIQFRSATCL